MFLGHHRQSREAIVSQLEGVQIATIICVKQVLWQMCYVIIGTEERSQLMATTEPVGQLGQVVIAQVQVPEISRTRDHDELQKLVIPGY